MKQINGNQRNIRIALPSKGRLAEDALDLMKNAGLAVMKSNPRQYKAKIPVLPEVSVLFQRPGDIAVSVRDGIVDFGITGFDVVSEKQNEARDILIMLDKLGFGECRFCAIVPESEEEINHTQNLQSLIKPGHQNLRVATKFPNITQQFFEKKNFKNVTYIVAEGPRGMVLLDQHAAHERVLFEEFLSARQRAAVPSQTLLEPALVDLGPEAADVLQENADVLGRLGFEIESFGGSTILVRSVPTIVGTDDPGRVLSDVVGSLLAGNQPLAASVEEAVARQVCKRAAIKAGQVLDQVEMGELIRALEQCESPHTCPHGRPTMIHLTVEHLAREFGRT